MTKTLLRNPDDLYNWAMGQDNILSLNMPKSYPCTVVTDSKGNFHYVYGDTSHV